MSNFQKSKNQDFQVLTIKEIGNPGNLKLSLGKKNFQPGSNFFWPVSYNSHPPPNSAKTRIQVELDLGFLLMWVLDPKSTFSPPIFENKHDDFFSWKDQKLAEKKVFRTA